MDHGIDEVVSGLQRILTACDSNLVNEVKGKIEEIRSLLLEALIPYADEVNSIVESLLQESKGEGEDG